MTESMWEKIQRERKEGHPKYKGGKFNGVELKPTYHFEHKDKLSQTKFHNTETWDVGVICGGHRHETMQILY